jgi:hypothetical protein
LDKSLSVYFFLDLGFELLLFVHLLGFFNSFGLLYKSLFGFLCLLLLFLKLLISALLSCHFFFLKFFSFLFSFKFDLFLLSSFSSCLSFGSLELFGLFGSLLLCFFDRS